MQKKYKHIVFILIGVLGFGILIYHSANYFAHKKLVALLNERNSDISIDNYEDLKVNIWKGKLHLTNLSFKWQDGNGKNTSFIGSEYIHIDGIKLLKLWKDQDIEISRLEILNAKVHIESNESIKKESTDSSKNPDEISKINIAEVFIKNIAFSNHNEKDVLRSKFILKEARLHDLKPENWKLPNDWFTNLSHYKIEIEELYHQATEWEILKVNSMELSDTEYKVHDLNFYTELDKKEYNERLTHERDHYKVNVPNIRLSALKWDIKEGRERFFSSKIEMESPDLIIYRDKRLPDDLRVKPLFIQLLRELRFDIQTDEIHIDESNITYIERVQDQNNGGSIYFSDFNAVLTHAGNFKEVNEHNPVRIKVETTFMKTGKLKADWQFNPQDKNDAFHFKAEIVDLDANRANTFTEPNLFVKMEGKITHVYLNIHGTNTNSNTDFAISYNDLKVNLLEKDGKKQKKLISALANIFVRKNSESKNTIVQEEKVEVERDQTKSIFNFLWKNTLAGLKKTILKV